MSTTKKASAKKARGPVERLLSKWPSRSGRDVKVKDGIRTAEDFVIDVIGRWTRRTESGNVPLVTGHIVKFAAGVAASAGGTVKKVGDRQNGLAAECAHMK